METTADFDSISVDGVGDSVGDSAPANQQQQQQQQEKEHDDDHKPSSSTESNLKSELDAAEEAEETKSQKHKRKKGRVSASYGSRTTIVETGQKRRSCICAHPRCNEIMTKWAKCNPSMYHYVQLPKFAGMDAQGNVLRNISDTELYKNHFRLATLRYLKVKNPLPKDERIAVLHYHPEVREFLYWPKNTPAHSKYAIPRTLAATITNHSMDLEKDRCRGLNQQDWCYVVPCYDFDTSMKEILQFEAKFYETVSDVKKNANKFVREYQALREENESLKKHLEDMRQQQHNAQIQAQQNEQQQQLQAAAIAAAAGMHAAVVGVPEHQQQLQHVPQPHMQQQQQHAQPMWENRGQGVPTVYPPMPHPQNQQQQPTYYTHNPQQQQQQQQHPNPVNFNTNPDSIRPLGPQGQTIQHVQEQNQQMIPLGNQQPYGMDTVDAHSLTNMMAQQLPQQQEQQEEEHEEEYDQRPRKWPKRSYPQDDHDGMDNSNDGGGGVSNMIFRN
jgi:regulator of replication initiation timing